MTKKEWWNLTRQKWELVIHLHVYTDNYEPDPDDYDDRTQPWFDEMEDLYGD